MSRVYLLSGLLFSSFFMIASGPCTDKSPIAEQEEEVDDEESDDNDGEGQEEEGPEELGDGAGNAQDRADSENGSSDQRQFRRDAGANNSSKPKVNENEPPLFEEDAAETDKNPSTGFVATVTDTAKNMAGSVLSLAQSFTSHSKAASKPLTCSDMIGSPLDCNGFVTSDGDICSYNNGECSAKASPKKCKVITEDDCTNITGCVWETSKKVLGFFSRGICQPKENKCSLIPSGEDCERAGCAYNKDANTCS